MRSSASVIVLASVIGIAVAQSPSSCTDADSCVLKYADGEMSCAKIMGVKACYEKYCPQLGVPFELNSYIDACENGGTLPGSDSGSGSGSGSDTDNSETGTRTGSGSSSTSTSGSGSSSGGTCTDRQAYTDCINPLAKLDQTCKVILQAAKCFDNYCPQRAFQIEEEVAACQTSSSGSSSGSSSSGSTRTSSADDSASTGFNSGIPGGDSTRSSSAADSTGTGFDLGSSGNSTTADPTNTSSKGNGPVSTNSPSKEGAADRLFAPAGAIVGSMIAIMAWL
ncbi:hypothetical protein VC83_01630 [Pseudogymnoascus destructans]|uniref:Extracellular membrane protein CFEM domain-containing protein n=2 Tax=Pseudogymnoascus destructans TaxID=655981 RepID=L8G4S8_PSED2|nr:uncharacterized protein VC83_01630 [Pseudogymnoascus destructans]ELR08102.1 hypothetical protein GMDG_02929 [Pseudogymnoascus destructans 20631-21]OAF61830.1 hypothetical protein VC83_01630 [Pseudogymnoascus destructans]